MAETTTYATIDGFISSTTDGATLSGTSSTGTLIRTGRDAGGLRAEALLAWPTDLGVGSDTITDGVLTLTVETTYAAPAGPMTLEARAHDWAAFTSAAWVPRVELGTKPLLASTSITEATPADTVLTLDSYELPGHLAANHLVKETRMVLCTDLHRTEVPAWTVVDSIRLRSTETTGLASDPAITITHTPAGVTVTGTPTMPPVTAAGTVTAELTVTGAAAMPAVTASGSVTVDAAPTDLGPVVAVLAEPTIAAIREATVWTAGDTESDFRAQVVESLRTRQPVDMTGHTVSVRIRRPDGTLIERAGTVEPGTDGWVSMQWQPGDLAAGRHHWEVVDDTGGDQTFPPTPLPYFDVRAAI